MACDIHFKKVSLLLDFDGAGGSTTFADMSNFGNILTPHAGASVDATAPKFGNGCLQTTTGYLTAPSVSGDSLDLSTGDFTVECWIKLNAGPTPGVPSVFVNFGVTGISGVQMGVYDNGGGQVSLYAGWKTVAGGSGSTVGSITGMLNNQWYAVCVERVGRDIRLFIDGAIVVTGDLGAANAVLVAYTELSIGRDGVSNQFDGEIDELRVTKGYARYRETPYVVATSAFGVACVGQQPVTPYIDNNGAWSTFITPVSNVNPYTWTYDIPTWQDPDVNVAVLFSLSFIMPTSLELDIANVVATYGGQPCVGLIQNGGPDTYIEGQRATLILLCKLPLASTFTDNVLTVNVSGVGVDVVSWVVSLGATAQLVDPSADLTPNVQTASGATSDPITLTIPALALDINWLMVSEINCAVSAPGNPDVVSTPAFHVDFEAPSGIPLAVAERSLSGGAESNAVEWEYFPSGPSGFQAFWGITFGLPPVDFGVVVPSVIGDTPSEANTEITDAGFVVGSVTTEPSNLVPAGMVFAQSPAGGFSADPGSAVDYIVSSGPAPAFVPNIVGETVSQANSDITGNGFQVGATSTAHSDTVPAGIVISQSPAGGTQAALGTFVSYVISSGPQPPPPPTTGAKFNFEATVISQYANSPTLLQLCSNMNDYVDQSTNFATFFDFIWNVNTAQGFGLDIWGKIVNISRLLTIPNTSRNFGFKDNVTPPDYDPFNVSPFNSKGGAATQTYLLNDAAYRTLILTKALSNISATTAPAINQLLRNLFPGRGRCYVLDLGGMAMQFTFEFQLTVTEFAILAQSKALPRPAGVAVNIVTLSGGSVLGFAEAGGSAESFGFGHFY